MHVLGAARPSGDTVGLPSLMLLRLGFLSSELKDWGF